MASSAGLRKRASQAALGVSAESTGSTSATSTTSTSSSSTTTSVGTRSFSKSASHAHSGHHHGHDHSHSHKHGEEETEALVAALQGSSDPGSRITLIGLAANVVLTGTKGAAGYFLSSASLLADAGHSLSDLLGDFVTLFCWKLARRKPTAKYPYGYGKYESLGSLIVSFFLLGGAIGIGIHSYSLLITVLSTAAASPETLSVPTATILNSLPTETILANATALSDRLTSYLPIHDHSADAIVDIRAAWFALLSVVVKEWLYRRTMKVGKELGSGVLMANAIHHRSDAFSSVVALLAIGGSSLGFPVLDPIGGLVVSGMILKAGAGIGYDAFKELVDEVTDPTFVEDVRRVADARLATAASDPDVSVSIDSIRAFKSGAAVLVDLLLVVPGDLSVRQAHTYEDAVRAAIKAEKKTVREVVVRFKPA